MLVFLIDNTLEMYYFGCVAVSLSKRLFWFSVWEFWCFHTTSPVFVSLTFALSFLCSVVAWPQLRFVTSSIVWNTLSRYRATCALVWNIHSLFSIVSSLKFFELQLVLTFYEETCLLFLHFDDFQKKCYDWMAKMNPHSWITSNMADSDMRVCS